ncbi:MAG: hypothetical protein GC152_10190 [Alphaproteobacteria bacterium]|nr:hypothetical protein [Alphaproteobacteria bacterium]
MRGALRLFAAGLSAAAVAALGSTAFAGEEKPCGEQYSLEEQLMLEWAALGGDPHAQFALAQCALPEGAKDLAPEARAYAVKWVTLASCDAVGADDVAARDRRTRRLKAQGDLSFRRFEGLENDDDIDLNRKEKRFVEYREHKTKELMNRMKRLKKMASSEEFDFARAELGDQFARFGPLGRMRFATLAGCPQLDAPKSYVAAAWASAADAWDEKRDSLKTVYGAPEKSDWSFRKEAEARVAGLSTLDRATFDYEKQTFERYDDERLAALEADAALARLGEMSTLGSVEFASPAADPVATTRPAAEPAAITGDQTEGERNLLVEISSRAMPDAAPGPTAGFEGPSVTIATQYALEALGFMEFVNGPDNDYGPSTIEAVARAQSKSGMAPTRWMSHREVRDTICRAATEAGDPVSYYHVATMYLRGQGFPKQLAKARYAINQADALLEVKLLDRSSLPKWKADVYPKIRAEILAAKAELDAEWGSLPAATQASMNNWRASSEGLCR